MCLVNDDSEKHSSFIAFTPIKKFQKLKKKLSLVQDILTLFEMHFFYLHILQENIYPNLLIFDI